MQFQKYSMVPLEVLHHANVGKWDCPTKMYRFFKKSNFKVWKMEPNFLFCY